MVKNLGAHGVPDVDFFSENTGIPNIAVFGFSPHVKIHEVFVGGYIPIELAFLAVGAVAAMTAAERTVIAVFTQVAVSVNFYGFSRQPPVEKVKMMGGFMNKEAARILFKGMPAPKI